LLLTGCQRTIADQTLKVETNTTKRLDIDGPTYAQKAVVEVNSSAGPVDVWIVLEKDRSAVEGRLLNNKEPAPDKVVGSKKKFESGTVEGNIPAGQAYSVIVSGAKKKGDVHLKVTGH
jgi:hypothetical protein